MSFVTGKSNESAQNTERFAQESRVSCVSFQTSKIQITRRSPLQTSPRSLRRRSSHDAGLIHLDFRVSQQWPAVPRRVQSENQNSRLIVVVESYRRSHVALLARGPVLAVPAC